MTTIPPNEFHDFNQFVVVRLPVAGEDLSVQECVATFRAYQAKIYRGRKAIPPSY